MLYSLFPHIVEATSAAFININLLTADFYAVLIGILALKYNVSRNLESKIEKNNRHYLASFFVLCWFYFHFVWNNNILHE